MDRDKVREFIKKSVPGKHVDLGNPASRRRFVNSLLRKFDKEFPAADPGTEGMPKGMMRLDTSKIPLQPNGAVVMTAAESAKGDKI